MGCLEYTNCNELPAVRRVDGVCVVYVRRKTKHDLTVRDRLTCISNALSLVVEVTVREEEYRGDSERREEENCNTQEQRV